MARKRPNGTGSLIQYPGSQDNPAKCWIGRIRLNGETYVSPLTTKAKAQAFLTSVMAKANEPVFWEGAPDLPTGALVEEWIDSQDFAEGSMKSYRWARDLLEPLADIPAADLTPQEVAGWVGSLELNHYGVRRALGVLRRSLDMVFAQGNPAQHIHVPRE